MMYVSQIIKYCLNLYSAVCQLYLNKTEIKINKYYVESKKWYKWTYLQNRNRVTNVENKCMVTKGKQGGGGEIN